jgi:hypothetical protein
MKSADTNPVSILPATVRAVLPQTLFQNEFVSLIRVQLRRGCRLHFARPVLRLLTVAGGRVRMHGPHGSFILQGPGCWRLENGEHWKIRALADTHLSLFVVRATA